MKGKTGQAVEELYKKEERRRKELRRVLMTDFLPLRW